MNKDQIKYPYPVLGHSDDINSEWGCSYTAVCDQENIKITIEANNVLRELHELISLHKAQYVCEILCNKTFLRTIESSFDDEFIVTISRENLRDTLCLTLYIVATEDQKLYDSPLFKQVYIDNKKFLPSIQKGEILAQMPTYSMPVEIDYSEINTQPIIEIKKGKSEDKYEYVDYNKDTIYVVLPEVTFVKLNRLKQCPEYLNIFHSSFIYNALTIVVPLLSEKHKFHSNYSDKLWAQKLKLILMDDKYKGLDPILDTSIIVQKLLECPYNKMLDDLQNFNQK